MVFWTAFKPSVARRVGARGTGGSGEGRVAGKSGGEGVGEGVGGALFNIY